MITAILECFHHLRKKPQPLKLSPLYPSIYLSPWQPVIYLIYQFLNFIGMDSYHRWPSVTGFFHLASFFSRLIHVVAFISTSLFMAK